MLIVIENYTINNYKGPWRNGIVTASRAVVSGSTPEGPISSSTRDKLYKSHPPIKNMQKKSEFTPVKKLTSKEVQLMLIDNFVNLQRVLTNLTAKFDGLSDNIAKLLQLYETAAKSFLTKVENGSMTPEDKDIVKKLDTLLEQNKTVAKGLTLMEEKIRHKIYGDHIPPQTQNTSEVTSMFGEKPKPRPLPRM